MNKTTREQFEKDIFDAALILFRWRNEPYLDPEDAWTEQDLALHAELGITAEPQLGRLPPIHYYGIECGDGWLPLIKDALSEIEELLEKSLKSKLSNEHLPVVLQIKEKFGYLRIAMKWFPSHFISEEIRNVISHAANKSRTVCENCGITGLNPDREGMQSCCGQCVKTVKY